MDRVLTDIDRWVRYVCVCVCLQTKHLFGLCSSGHSPRYERHQRINNGTNLYESGSEHQLLLLLESGNTNTDVLLSVEKLQIVIMT